MLCSLILHFLTFEDGTNKLSRNMGKELILALHNISEEQRSHMTIWWCRPWFGFAWSGSEQSGLA